AVLELAQATPGAEELHWVEADARPLRLGERFDQIVMTGHAFQTLLSPGDRAAGLATIALHLAPGGRFVFDSRNPAVREWEDWRPGPSLRRIDDPVLGPVAAWDEAAWHQASGVAPSETHY